MSSWFYPFVLLYLCVFLLLLYSHLGFYALQLLKIDLKNWNWPSCSSFKLFDLLWFCFYSKRTHKPIKTKLMIVGLKRKKKYELIEYMNVCYLKKPVLLYNKFNLADIHRTVYVQNSVYVRVIVVVFLIVFCFVLFCRLTEAKRFCIVNILCLKRKK